MTKPKKMKTPLKLCTTFDVITKVMFLCNLLESNKVKGQGIDIYEDFNLLENVATPTPAICDDELRKRAIVKRSSNDSSHETSDAVPLETFDDCVVYPTYCPKKIKISWLQAAPFVYTSREAGDKTEGPSPILKGIFVDIVRRAIGYCCQRMSRDQPNIRYNLNRASNLEALQLELLDGSADMIIPVHSDEAKYGGTFPYVKILDSPGVVLIQRYSALHQWKLVLKAVLGTWPVVLIALLMSFVAGVAIWLLVS